MQVLVVHRRGLGQFGPLAARLAADPAFAVAAISGEAVADAPCRIVLAPQARPAAAGHPYLVPMQEAVLHGQATARAARSLVAGGFVPDLVLVHPGWGDALFLPEILPGTPLVTYAEFYCRTEGADLGWDADLQGGLDLRCALALRNAPLLLALEAATAAIAPTRWQRDLHPEPYRSRISVIHEGVDTDRVRPDAAAAFRLADGRVLTAADEVVSYVARDLEPHRGFPALMRALPRLLALRPRAEIVICGGDGVSYGRSPQGHATWRARMLAETGPLPPRVHWVGRLGYDAYLSLLQVSRLHLYPSAPFVLSWSLTEALAAACLVLASDTAPVREVIADGRNGFLADPRVPEGFAARAADLLSRHADLAGVREAARATVLASFRREDCLARQVALLSAVASRAADTRAVPSQAPSAETPSAETPSQAARPGPVAAPHAATPSAATIRGRNRRQSGAARP